MRDFSRGPQHLGINQATTRAWSLEQAIEGYARHGVRGIAVWRDKLAELGTNRAASMLKAHDMTVTGLCRAGVLPPPDNKGWRAAFDDNRRAIDEAAAIGARCLIMVAGGLPAGSKDLAGAQTAVRDGLAELLPHARAAKVSLALEPLHPMYAADRACVNTLAHANDLCDALGPGVGVAVDVYHVWWDPGLEREIARAGAARRLVAFHVCDWLVPTTDLLLDRGMPGDGVIDIRKIRGWMEAAGYDGFAEVEIFSARTWWQRPPDEVVRTCMERHRTVV
jgi:sugar phosphate isomerase/epimerase